MKEVEVVTKIMMRDPLHNLFNNSQADISIVVSKSEEQIQIKVGCIDYTFMKEDGEFKYNGYGVSL